MQSLDPNLYLGIPYKNGGRDREGIDCWGLVKLIYDEYLDVVLYDLGDHDLDHYEKHWSLKGEDYISKFYHINWERVSEPEPFDMVLVKNKRGVVDHVGVMIDREKFIQCLTQGVVVSKLSSLGDLLEGFFRYKHDKSKILSH